MTEELMSSRHSMILLRFKTRFGFRQSFVQLYQIPTKIEARGDGNVYTGIQISDGQPAAIKQISKGKLAPRERIKHHLVPLEDALMRRCKICYEQFDDTC